MKRAIYITLILLTVSLVFAGTINQIDLDEKITHIAITEGDAIEFNLFEGRHVIGIDKIHKKGVDLDVFLFVDGEQRISYITVGEERTLKLDLDKDGKGDLFVGFEQFLIDEGAILKFYLPGEETNNNQATGLAIKEDNNSKEGDLMNWYFGIVILVLTILLIVTITIHKRNKSKSR